ncbi:MAG TPA: histidine phosphatase family protein [Alphaproteobacteria bacterium]|nr:histidine phosphatase family protein [Alphaproteobacteria bacterium]
MTVVTRWWWIRHAPVTADGGRVYGQTDIECDVSDRAPFQALAGKLPREAVWVSSNLKRAYLTAAAIRDAGLIAPEPIIERGLAEQHFGEWQGQIRAEIYARNPDWRGFWLTPAHAVPPGGESFVQVIARTREVIDRLNKNHRGRSIVAVAHGGTIRAALACALKLEPEMALAFTIDNLAVTRLDHIAQGQGEAWRVGVVNLPAR